LGNSQTNYGLLTLTFGLDCIFLDFLKSYGNQLAWVKCFRLPYGSKHLIRVAGLENIDFRSMPKN